jgi:hypothetical protein
MRKLIGILGVAMSIALATSAAAWACTNLSALNLGTSSGQPGETVAFTGTAFATSSGSDVVLHWNTVDDNVIGTVTPDAVGTIRGSVVVPADAQPGNNVIVATQDYTDGDGVTSAAYGTPARASFLVGTPLSDVAAPLADTSTPVGTAAESGSGGGLILLSILLAVGGFGLFGAGLAAYGRQSRPTPATAPVERS